MNSCEELDRATSLLRSTICNFSIGAVTLNDFKPIEERIKDAREIIKCQKARIAFLSAVNKTRVTSELSPDNPKELEKTMLEVVSSKYVHKNKILKICLQSLAAERILSNDRISPEMSSKLDAVMNKLYDQNDKIILLREELDGLYAKQKDLQAETAAAVIDFQDFLKEQEQVCNNKLAQSNPEIARKKQKLKAMILKINISRRIVTNLISVTSNRIPDDPELMRMLKDHRDLVNAETIMEMAQNRET